MVAHAWRIKSLEQDGWLLSSKVLVAASLAGAGETPQASTHPVLHHHLPDLLLLIILPTQHLLTILNISSAITNCTVRAMLQQEPPGEAVACPDPPRRVFISTRRHAGGASPLTLGTAGAPGGFSGLSQSCIHPSDVFLGRQLGLQSMGWFSALPLQE